MQVYKLIKSFTAFVYKIGLFELYYGRTGNAWRVQYPRPGILRQSAHGDVHDHRSHVKSRKTCCILFCTILSVKITMNASIPCLNMLNITFFTHSEQLSSQKRLIFAEFFFLLVRGVASGTHFATQIKNTLNL